MRLDKYLAHAGLGTRKEVKLAIRKGRVSVNGEVCRKDDRKIQEGVDVVCLDKEEIYYEAVVYIMLNKPQDVVSATSDPTYETVLDCIDAFLPKDCFPVGRLDMDTEGLLLITNDGKLAHRLLSPKHHVEKTYLVDLAQPLQEGDQKKLENGSIVLDEEPVLPGSCGNSGGHANPSAYSGGKISSGEAYVCGCWLQGCLSETHSHGKSHLD